MSNEELVKRIQNSVDPDKDMEQLYLQNKGFIRKIARMLAYTQDDIDDLMQEAYFGLREAVKRYDDTAGVMFLTYAAFWIKQSMTRYLAKYESAVNIPEHLQRKIFQYQRFNKEYKKLHGVEPDDDIICKYMSIDLKDLHNLKKVFHDIGSLESLETQIPDADDILLKDSIAGDIDVENEVINNLHEESLKKELWEIVKNNTTDVENEVICMRYKQNMTLQAIANKKGLTRERIRQIESKGLRNLRKPKVRRLLEEKFEINYARAYRGSLSYFKNRWSSIVEDIALKNLEDDKENISLL